MIVIIVILSLELMTSSFGLELWLEDYTRIKNTDGDIQSDSPHGPNDEDPWEYECPIVPKDGVTKSTIQCLQVTCETDLDCNWPVYKCCSNGCIKTCLEGVPPPPYVDWRREPQRDPMTGISWLIGDDADDAKEEKELKNVLSHSHLAERCQLNNTVYSDGTEFTHHSYLCKCHKGLIYCNVDKRKKR